MSFNKIILVGNLGRDPELRYTPQGNAVCNFSMATNEKRRGRDGEQQDVTTWFRVTLWGKQAENASKYLTKGSPVYIEGRLRVEEWNDRDGKSRHTLDVQATDMQFIGSRQDEMSSAAGSGGGSGSSTSGGGSFDQGYTDDFTSGGGSGSSTGGSSSPNDDDIPF